VKREKYITKTKEKQSNIFPFFAELEISEAITLGTTWKF